MFTHNWTAGSAATGYSHGELKLCQNILRQQCCLLALQQQCWGASIHGIQEMLAINKKGAFPSPSVNHEKNSHDWWLDSFILETLNWQQVKYTDHWPCWSNMIHNMEIPLLIGNICWPQGPIQKCTHIYIDTHVQHTYMSTHTHTQKYTEVSFYSVILGRRLLSITQSAQYGWESTIKCYSEKELSRDSPLWRDRSHGLTAREACHTGQRLWNYLGWHSLAFPCKTLPEGAARRLIIDVNRGKRMLISQCPAATSELHTIPLLDIRVHWERAGERFWWWECRFRAMDRQRPRGVFVGTWETFRACSR